MSNFQFYYTVAYRRARDESRIDWHSEDPPALLVEAVESIAGPGRALDVGCGTGVSSVFMAQRGLDVTAIDFVPEALPFAIRRAEKAGVKVDFKVADATKFEPVGRYDLVVDVGCFHGLNDKSKLLYRARLMNWLSDGGQFVLVHFGKRHTFDFGIIGPKPRRKEEIERFFAPELSLENFLPETMGKPLYQYRFTRNRAR